MNQPGTTLLLGLFGRLEFPDSTWDRCLAILYEIVSRGNSGIESSARVSVDQPLFRTVVFSTIVYDNPEKITITEAMVQPAQRMDIYYELLVVIIIVPALMLLVIIIYMKFRKTNDHSQEMSTPI